jgi:D-glycero-D-manno-heptose 1,7-bisphosphate phosphatase
MNLRPGLFLDRDGVVNEEAGYLHRWEECRIVDGIAELIATANELDYVTCIVTNQAGIGRGYYTEADFHALMDRISNALLERGARIDAIYFSPFHPEHGRGAYKRATDCRKPGPGMILRAAAEHGIDLGQSVMVGDRCTDMEAAAAAGVSDLYLFGTTETLPCQGKVSYTRTNHLSLIRESLLSRRGSFQPLLRQHESC